MKPLPKSVIHINFIVGDLLFDPRPIWAGLTKAVERGEVPATIGSELPTRFGETAIHLATRNYVMKRAIKELKTALGDIYTQVPDPWNVPVVDAYRVVRGEACEDARDRVLLAIDSFLFEFRAYLDLLARFVHGVLVALGKGPGRTEVLSSGSAVHITGRKGNLKPHDFLLYLCDKLHVATDWYGFLSTCRNFFTHEAAPYCEIEDLMARPPEFDLIIMKANIHDFHRANQSDWFRMSECQSVVKGIHALCAAAQQYLVDVLGK
jgi:hypothetical protein